MFEQTPGVVDVDDSSIAAAPRKLLLVDRRKAAMLGVPQAAIVSTLRAGLAGEAAAYLHDAEQVPGAGDCCSCRPSATAISTRCCSWQCAVPPASWCRSASWSRVSDTLREQPVYHKDLLPVNYVVADMAGAVDSPLYGMFDDARRRARPRHAGRRHARPNTSSASRAIPTAATPSSGTASGRSPTRPSATWARPMRWGWS